MQAASQQERERSKNRFLALRALVTKLEAHRRQNRDGSRTRCDDSRSIVMDMMIEIYLLLSYMDVGQRFRSQICMDDTHKQTRTYPLCMCIHALRCVCLHEYIRRYTHICAFTYVHVFMYVCMCVSVCMYVCMYVCMHVFVCLCVCVSPPPASLSSFFLSPLRICVCGYTRAHERTEARAHTHAGADREDPSAQGQRTRTVARLRTLQDAWTPSSSLRYLLLLHQRVSSFPGFGTGWRSLRNCTAGWLLGLRAHFVQTFNKTNVCVE